MEQCKQYCEYLQQLPKANPLQKKGAVPPKSIFPLLPLPDFKYSQLQFDLAPSFSIRQAKQQHLLKQTTLSKLFQTPYYKANNRYVLNSSNKAFACVKAFYSQSIQHSVVQVQRQNQEQIVFQSRFESGNLAFVAKSQIQNEYFLLLQKDINTSKCTQWFFFSVLNNSFRGKVRFHIVNFLKNYSSFENGMKISVCSQSNFYTWERKCDEIKYLKNNIKIGSKTYYTLSFVYDFQSQNDVTYFAHSPPYTFSQLDKYLLDITNNNLYSSIFKRKTLTQSPGGNYVQLLTITNFKNQKDKRVVFITSRIHPGETPASFVCEGVINFLISNCDEAKKLRDHFIFKIVPMLNPDGVINGNYRCSLSGYVNRVWHYDNKISSPQIYYTKKAIFEQKSAFLFIDLHAHSKKRGIFMYGCQNRASPYLSRHIPYLLGKEISSFNYYQCNFGMKIGREGTSRLTVHHMLNLPYSYTMQHSFCSPIKQKYHFTSKHYIDVGKSICLTLRKYFCNRQENLQIFKQLWTNKELMKVGCGQDAQSSDDSQLDQPIQFKQLLQSSNRTFRKKQSLNIRSKLMLDLSATSPNKFYPRQSMKDTSPKKSQIASNILPPFLDRPENTITKKFVRQVVKERTEQNVIEELQPQMEEVYVSQRIDQRGQAREKDPQIVVLRSTSRYEFQQLQSLNNLFLPSLTSASYKRYAKKQNYNKQFIHVGRKYLQSKGLLKDEIRSMSKRKQGWKQQILSYI